MSPLEEITLSIQTLCPPLGHLQHGTPELFFGDEFELFPDRLLQFRNIAVLDPSQEFFEGGVEEEIIWC